MEYLLIRTYISLCPCSQVCLYCTAVAPPMCVFKVVCFKNSYIKQLVKCRTRLKVFSTKGCLIRKFTFFSVIKEALTNIKSTNGKL